MAEMGAKLEMPISKRGALFVLSSRFEETGRPDLPHFEIDTDSEDNRAGQAVPLSSIRFDSDGAPLGTIWDAVGCLIKQMAFEH